MMRPRRPPVNAPHRLFAGGSERQESSGLATTVHRARRVDAPGEHWAPAAYAAGEAAGVAAPFALGGAATVSWYVTVCTPPAYGVVIVTT